MITLSVFHLVFCRFNLKTSVFETGLSNFRGHVITLMKVLVARLKPKIIRYRSNKRFDPKKFLKGVKKAVFEYHTHNPDKSYDIMTSTFRNLVEKHAPLKSKVQKGNSAPFMTPELSRAI